MALFNLFNIEQKEKKAAKRQQDLGIASKATPSSSRRQKKKQKALLGSFNPLKQVSTRFLALGEEVKKEEIAQKIEETPEDEIVADEKMLFDDDSGDEEMPDDFGMEEDESDEELDDDPKASDEEDDEEKLENNLEEVEKVKTWCYFDDSAIFAFNIFCQFYHLLPYLISECSKISEIFIGQFIVLERRALAVFPVFFFYTF